MTTYTDLPVLLRQRWRPVLYSGAVFATLGALAILLPNAATIAVELLVGWLLLLAGISGLTFAWSIRQSSGWWPTVLVFGLTTVLGLLFLLFPSVGMATLTICLIVIFLMEGVSSLLLAWAFRGEPGSRGWMIFSGLCALGVGMLVWMRWPDSSVWVIGLLVEINLLSTGISLIMLALAARSRSGT